MDRRRRAITRAGTFPREWWYELSDVKGAVPWLELLGTQQYVPAQDVVAEVSATIEVTLMPHETIITASWERGSAKAKPKLEQVEGTRPHPTRKTRVFRIEACAEVRACEPSSGTIIDDDQEDGDPQSRKSSQQIVPIMLYRSVYVQGVDEKGRCQLRFDRQDDGSIHVALSSLENRRS